MVMECGWPSSNPPDNSEFFMADNTFATAMSDFDDQTSASMLLHSPATQEWLERMVVDKNPVTTSMGPNVASSLPSVVVTSNTAFVDILAIATEETSEMNQVEFNGNLPIDSTSAQNFHLEVLNENTTKVCPFCKMEFECLKSKNCHISSLHK